MDGLGRSPTPTPVSEARQHRDQSDTRIAWGTPPGLWTSVAVTNPVIDATAPTDRSIPPVSIVIV